jgi:large subunit ribosomal protein L29
VSTATELRDKTPQELSELIADTRRVLLDLRFQNASGELENTAGLREARRELARALTVAREREIEAVDEPAAAPPASAEPTEATEETETEEQP